MKQYLAELSNGLLSIVVADSMSQASLCVCNMLLHTGEYRDSELTVSEAYKICELEGVFVTPADGEILVSAKRCDGKYLDKRINNAKRKQSASNG